MLQQKQHLSLKIQSCSLDVEDKSTEGTEPQHHTGAEPGGFALYLCLGLLSALAPCSLSTAQA